jgi:hypothetical protein
MDLTHDQVIYLSLRFIYVGSRITIKYKRHIYHAAYCLCTQFRYELQNVRVSALYIKVH